MERVETKGVGAAAAVLGRVQGAYPARGGGLRGLGADRSPTAARGAVLLAPDRVAPAPRTRSGRGLGGEEAGTQVHSGCPRSRAREAAARERAAAPPADASRGGARGPKKTLGDPGDPPEPPRARRERRVRAVLEVAPPVELAVACRALGLARATVYRRRRPESASPRRRERRVPPPRALAPAEQAQVLAVLHSERFVDRAPAPVVATLLDHGQYLF